MSMRPRRFPSEPDTGFPAFCGWVFSAIGAFGALCLAVLMSVTCAVFLRMAWDMIRSSWF
jgi:hypothetical protein